MSKIKREKNEVEKRKCSVQKTFAKKRPENIFQTVKLTFITFKY